MIYKEDILKSMEKLSHTNKKHQKFIETGDPSSLDITKKEIGLGLAGLTGAIGLGYLLRKKFPKKILSRSATRQSSKVTKLNQEAEIDRLMREYNRRYGRNLGYKAKGRNIIFDDARFSGRLESDNTLLIVRSDTGSVWRVYPGGKSKKIR